LDGSTHLERGSAARNIFHQGPCIVRWREHTCVCQTYKCATRTTGRCVPRTTRCEVEILCDTKKDEATAENGKHPVKQQQRIYL